MLLMTGASRMVGDAAIPALIGAGLPFRILSSSAGSAEKLRRRGVKEVVIGDLRSSGDLAGAVKGVTTVVHVPPSVVEDEADMGFALIEAAAAEGVEHFIFVSCFHSQIADMRHHVSKVRVEQALIKSSLTYTILQPAMFMQNVEMVKDALLSRGLLEWPWDPEKKYAMLDTRDLAEVIAIVARDARFRGGAYELVSPDTISETEMARHLSGALGRPIKTGWPDAEEWAGHARAAGMPEWSVETVLGMCRFHDKWGYGGGNSMVLEMILGRPATRYADFAADFAKSLASA